MNTFDKIFNGISPNAKSVLLTVIASAVTITITLNALGIGPLRDAFISGYEKQIEVNMELQRQEIDIQKESLAAQLKTRDKLVILLEKQNKTIEDILVKIGSIDERVTMNTDGIRKNSNEILRLDGVISYRYPRSKGQPYPKPETQIELD